MCWFSGSLVVYVARQDIFRYHTWHGDRPTAYVSCCSRFFFCRYGNASDGGKLLCDLSKLSPPCIIYSLGSKGDYTFERDALKYSLCEVHTFDWCAAAAAAELADYSPFPSIPQHRTGQDRTGLCVLQLSRHCVRVLAQHGRFGSACSCACVY